MLRHWKPVLALALCGLGVAGMLSGRAIDRPPGVLVDSGPLQLQIAAAPFRVGDFELAPQASYDIEARVLSVEPYKWDRSAPLSPIDFAVGWGPMSDTAVLQHFRITQSARFFTLYPGEHAIDMRVALVNAANMHLIPATAAVGKRLSEVRRGHVVRLRGLLVNATGPNGFTWNTSLSREDSGAGACELFYVEEVEWR